MKITNLPDLIKQVRDQVEIYTGVNPFANTSSQKFENIYARVIFVGVLNHFYDIVENEKTTYVSEFLDTSRSNLPSISGYSVINSLLQFLNNLELE